MTKESIYDEEEVQTTEESPDVEDVGFEDEEIVAVISDKSPAERREETGVKEKADGRTLTIKEVSWTRPKTKGKDGQRIPPKVTKKGASYYGAKMRVRFEEENLVEYYPTITYWVNDGRVNPNIKINRTGNTKVSQLFREYVCAISEGKFKQVDKKINDKITKVIPEEQEKAFKEFADQHSDSAFLNWMVGKKVLIETNEGEYDGKAWFRNDIKGFVL
jgi:hypothetical protein